LRFEASEKTSQKSAGEVAQSVDPEFKPQYCKKKKKINYFIKNKSKLTSKGMKALPSVPRPLFRAPHSCVSFPVGFPIMAYLRTEGILFLFLISRGTYHGPGLD
jgi:hypothetical protein